MTKLYFYMRLCLIVMMTLLLGCADNKSATHPHAVPEDSLRTGNSMYYWKTEFRLSSWDRHFLATHGIRRLYLRFFDVDCGMDYDGAYKPIPVGSVAFCDTVPSEIEVVPVVFITSAALEHAYEEDGSYNRQLDLARLIHDRILAMEKGNHVPEYREIQLDFDWTRTNRAAFYDFCRRMKSYMTDTRKKLSCTLRLHQLHDGMPPVDRVTLMLYNTGSLYSPETKNSILDIRDVRPYLKRGITCKVPISVAYPTYSWGILMRGGKLLRILHQSDYSDSRLYARTGDNKYRVLSAHMLDGAQVRKGDVIRLERSDISEILGVKKLLLARLAKKPEFSIIYHLDSANLQNYSREEISRIYNN